jgi:hypothetical protein
VKDLENDNGKIRLVLRSKKVARIAELQGARGSPDSLLAWHGASVPSQTRRVVVYDYVFDDRQTRALDEARALARRTGLVLQVTDLSRQNVLARGLRLGLGKVGGAVGRLRLDAKASHWPKESGEDRMVRQQACRP